MARVYVVAPYLPHGGTFMAYHLARLLQLDFGFEAVAVTIGTETAANGVFVYDPVFPSIPLAALATTITDDDLLIANPSFSRFGLGFSCRGRKLMYIQGFTTYDVLDGGFDLYVCVSSFVRHFVQSLYGISPPVIPPFVQRETFPPPRPWSERPEGRILVNNKGHTHRQEVLLNRVVTRLAAARPGLTFDLLSGEKEPQPAFAARLGAYRLLLSLAPAEGFGLIPLEAMAMGTTVVGFDGFGGVDYLRSGQNCLAVPWPRLDDLIDSLLALLDDPARAEALAQEGQRTAAQPCYTHAHFRAAWRPLLAALLG